MVLREMKRNTFLEYSLCVKHELCANLRKAAALWGSRCGSGLGEHPRKSSFGEFLQHRELLSQPMMLWKCNMG